MVLAIRFRYFEARTPSFQIVELDYNQWREFFLLERSHMRMEWMIHYLHIEYKAHQIKELWWIPLDDQDLLTIAPQPATNN